MKTTPLLSIFLFSTLTFGSCSQTTVPFRNGAIQAPILPKTQVQNIQVPDSPSEIPPTRQSNIIKEQISSVTNIPSNTIPPIVSRYKVEKLMAEGRALFAQSEYARAKEAFESVLALSPHNEIAQFNIAVSLSSMGEFKPALDILLRLESTAEKKQKIYESIAEIYRFTGNCNESKTYFGYAKQTEKFCPVSLNAEISYLKGVKTMREKNFLKAKELFSKTLSEYPDYHQAKIYLAMTLRHLEQPHEALALIDSYNESDEMKYGITRELGYLYAVLGKCSKAKHYLTKIAYESVIFNSIDFFLDPNLCPLSIKALNLFDLGEAEMKNNQPEKAISFFKEAIAIQPNFDNAKEQLGYAQARNKDYKAALETFLDLKKTDTPPLLYLDEPIVKLYSQLGQCDAVSKYIQNEATDKKLEYSCPDLSEELFKD